jgi:aspartyl-tRNA(Asn)/glutamyl-tRNA(Gln) amidotransferase subunit A
VGINPHYGTPGNPFDRSLVPGGSSSGAGVSVADANAVVAIGTDTGGSVRIPAAFSGVVGFKPTQFRISRNGATPLSTSLDSIGPLANSIACCAITDAIMAGEPPGVPPTASVVGLRLAIPQCHLMEGLAPEVASAFAAACRKLSEAGALVSEIPFPEIDELPEMNAAGGIAPIEAYAWHRDLMARRGNEYDQRVRTRIERAAAMSAVDFIKLIEARADVIARSAARSSAFDALLAPTVPVTPPPITAFERDHDYRHLNAHILRNTSVFNFLDRCAATLPIQPPGVAGIGLMIVGEHGADRRLLAICAGIEDVLAAAA